MSASAAGSDTIDWADVRRRIDAVGAAIEGIHERSPEQSRALLEARAVHLARAEVASATRETVEVLVCTRGGEQWALETRFVVEVMRLGRVTPLPGADPDVVGVTAWRGAPLLLRQLAPAAEDVGERWIVSLGEDTVAFAMVVDAVPRLMDLPLASVRPATDDLARGRNWLRGVTEDAVLVVDGHELLRTSSGGGTS